MQKADLKCIEIYTNSHSHVSVMQRFSFSEVKSQTFGLTFLKSKLCGLKDLTGSE